MTVRIRIDISAGELVDRITILEIKVDRLGAQSRAAATRDLSRARARARRALPGSLELEALTEALRNVNRELWRVEDELRACEREQRFDAHFVALARRVYATNDRRSALKRAIDNLVPSGTREYKSHPLPEV
jgi:hypothetical protein